MTMTADEARAQVQALEADPEVQRALEDAPPSAAMIAAMHDVGEDLGTAQLPPMKLDSVYFVHELFGIHEGQTEVEANFDDAALAVWVMCEGTGVATDWLTYKRRVERLERNLGSRMRDREWKAVYLDKVDALTRELLEPLYEGARNFVIERFGSVDDDQMLKAVIASYETAVEEFVTILGGGDGKKKTE